MPRILMYYRRLAEDKYVLRLEIQMTAFHISNIVLQAVARLQDHCWSSTLSLTESYCWLLHDTTIAHH